MSLSFDKNPSIDMKPEECCRIKGKEKVTNEGGSLLVGSREEAPYLQDTTTDMD